MSFTVIFRAKGFHLDSEARPRRIGRSLETIDWPQRAHRVSGTRSRELMGFFTNKS